MNIPSELLYTSHDEWIRADGPVHTVGISDYAQDQLGEIVHVELPDVGKVVVAGDAVCEVESVKAVAEVYAPIGGKIVAVNDALEDNAEAINSDPYGSWLFKIESSETPDAMDADAYRAKVG